MLATGQCGQQAPRTGSRPILKLRASAVRSSENAYQWPDARQADGGGEFAGDLVRLRGATLTTSDLGHCLERNVGSPSNIDVRTCAPVDTTGYNEESRLAAAIRKNQISSRNWRAPRDRTPDPRFVGWCSVSEVGSSWSATSAPGQTDFLRMPAIGDFVAKVPNALRLICRKKTKQVTNRRSMCPQARYRSCP